MSAFVKSIAENEFKSGVNGFHKRHLQNISELWSTRLNHGYKNLDVTHLNINNNNMPRNRISLETKQRIIDTHNEGQDYLEVARVLGVARGTACPL